MPIDVRDKGTIHERFEDRTGSRYHRQLIRMGQATARVGVGQSG